MKKQLKGTILEQANEWFESGRKVILARVIQTWGSSPCPIGSEMIVNDKGDFLGSVSGGCVESNVINECIDLMKKNNYEIILGINKSIKSASYITNIVIYIFFT